MLIFFPLGVKMNGMSGRKKRRAPLIIVILLVIIILIPLITIGLSFIGRIDSDSVIPDSFDFYANVPDPVRLAERVLNHESLHDIMALAELAPIMPALDGIKNSGLTANRLVHFAARGRLDAALLDGGYILAAWDAGIVSPLLRFLPVLAGRITIPGLYYVKAGKNSRFEYRQGDGPVFFIGPYKNLLIISNNSALFESVIGGSSREGDRYGSTAKKFNSRNYDIAFLLSPEALKNFLGGSGSSDDDVLLPALSQLQFPAPVEMSLSILPNQLKLNIETPLLSSMEDLQKLIERNSQATPLSAMIPDSAQYLTLLSAGSLKELLSGASSAAGGPSGKAEWENAIRKADSTARMTLGMNLEELLYSWTGNQFAVYGLEGRPNPVIALEIKDEKKRKEVFDRAFRSIFLNENIRLNLDGSRIPRIELPGFLNSFLEFLGLNIPSPYYTVQNNYIFISESAETILAAVNAVRRNEVLPKTDLWRSLSAENSGPASFSIFYSLDRSLPFFLKGSGAAMSVLKLYRQGLMRLYLENSVMKIYLSVLPGAGKGLVSVPGYPIDLASYGQGRVGSRLYALSSGRDRRLVFTRGNSVLAVNPQGGAADSIIKEYALDGPPGANLYAVPNDKDGAVWVVNSQGQVSSVSKDLENSKGFPLSTGLLLSSPPGVWGGTLYLPGEDGSIHTVSGSSSVSRWGKQFSSALRSPPSFIDFSNKMFAAVYPKSFLGEIYILDAAGNPLPDWPAYVSGIAFGSPLLFSAKDGGKAERLFAAFITQAGELTVYNENAGILQGFPVQLEGVFYLQPVFDGENLWIIESEGTLYKITLNAEVLSQKIPRLSVREGGFIAALSRDRSNTDIFFSGEGNALYGYNRHFNSLDGFPLPVWGRPVLGDLNGDGKIEISGLGMDNKLYMWQFR